MKGIKQLFVPLNKLGPSGVVASRQVNWCWCRLPGNLAKRNSALELQGFERTSKKPVVLRSITSNRSLVLVTAPEYYW